MSAKFHFAVQTLKKSFQKAQTFLKGLSVKKQSRMQQMDTDVCPDSQEDIREYHRISCRNTPHKTYRITHTITIQQYYFTKKFVTICHTLFTEFCKNAKRAFGAFTSYIQRIGSIMKKSVVYVKHHHLCRDLAALAVLVLMIGSGIFAFTNYFDIGYKVVADGQVIGTVKQKSDYYLALSLANTDIANSYGSHYISSKGVTFEKSILSKNNFSDKTSLKKQVMSTNEKLAMAYVVKVDGVDLLAAPNEETAQTILDRYKDRYRPENCTELKFNNQINIVKKYAPKSMEKDENTGLDYLVALHMQAATINSMSTNSSNAVLSDGTDTSQTKTVSLTNQSKPSLEVVSVQKTSTEKSVPFTSTVTYNPNKYEDAEPVVTVAGVEGKNKIESTVTRVNSAIVSQVVNQESVISSPVNEVIEKGSKKRPTGVGTGTFSAPVAGTITSKYGPRKSGFHTGMDLAIAPGTPVKAADEGKVIFAGYKGNYGNLVIIDHQNGYVTYYAHNSSLNVAVGDIVAKGDVIAAVGSTGNSTGPHCHFEIRINGSTVDPYPYLF